MNDTYQDDLKAHLDGELPPLRRLAVRLHLTHCASCREEIKQMTQIAEDFRAGETEQALDPALRAKILGIAPTSEGVGEGSPRPSSPTSPKLGGGGRKRLPLGWAIAGAALVAWFVCYPAYQYTRHDTRQAQALTSPLDAQRITAERSDRRSIIPAPKVEPPPPPKPVSVTVRLSNREAGLDALNGNAPYVQIKNPDSHYSDGRIQTFDAGAPQAGFEPLTSYGSAGTAAADTAGNSLRQVHKEASIGVQVPNPETTSDSVENMVKETGGYVASNNLSTGDDGLKSAELVVKVPVAQFETFLAQVAKLGSVQSKNVSGEDITEKTSDADQTESVLEDDVQQSEARLKSLGSRAKWHDEQATRDLRIQLAEARARLVLLKRMATLGTLTIDLNQTPKPTAPAPVSGGFLNGLKSSTHDALQSLVSSASALIALVIWLLAYAPLWVPALLVGRYALREYQKRQVA